ncbi:hypothetical protein GBA52_002698 [Prunus armeniaca]|nr:hypothetical protein GBA52_002698 [Prunus armeniaca]
MKWEQGRVGWVGGNERRVRVERVEEFGGTGGRWKRFGAFGRKGREIYTSTPRDSDLGEAPSLDIALRARLPDFDFPLSCRSSNPVVVGKWYCRFVFIKDGTPKDEMSRIRLSD